VPFVPELLWTDRLIWLLVAAASLYGWYCRRRAHLAAPWARVFHTRTAVVASVVLLAYLAVGLADSLHFRKVLAAREGGSATAYSTEVLSLLDLALGHLRERSEKTYSAPFATRLYAMERIESPQDAQPGGSARGYPRLRFGGAHLADEDDRAADIGRTALAATLAAVIAWLVLAATVAFFVARARASAHAAAWRALWRGRTHVPWNAALLAVGVLMLIAFPLYALSFDYHVLGTDKVGRDVLYQSLKSVRTSLVIGTLTALVALPLGVVFGCMAGYFRGRVDDVIQYVYTTINSIPGVLLIAGAVLALQVFIEARPEMFPTAAHRADFRLLVLCLILGFTGWIGLARLLRGETLKLAELEYIQAAHAFGVSDARILARHVLPNVAHIVVITAVMEFSHLVLAEAVLSYIGVGVDPATTSFGTMINGARLEMAREPMVWWSLGAAFAFMVVLVLAANLFADVVRDGFDPRAHLHRSGHEAAPA
jgi:peptide/nickel transport system permease protein